MTHLVSASDTVCAVTLIDLYVLANAVNTFGKDEIRKGVPPCGLYSQSAIVCLICVVQCFQCDFLTMCTAEVKLLQVKFIPPTNPVISYKAIHLFFQRINGFPQSVLSSSYKGF